jgi:osmotically-inducible protein OsmY
MNVSLRPLQRRRPLVLTALLAASALMSACAPLLVGGAMVGGAMVVTDRRTSGTQLEDQGIELKSSNRLREVLADRGRVSSTSYNRLVLLTGEVSSEADKAAAEQAVARVENVRATVNELTVLGSGAFASSLANRSNDLILSGKVKATFVDAKDVQANAFKVVTDRGVVYLMGRVTEREADRATELARSINGVQKVVRVFEIISEAELANMRPGAEKK